MRSTPSFFLPAAVLIGSLLMACQAFPENWPSQTTSNPQSGGLPIYQRVIEGRKAVAAHNAGRVDDAVIDVSSWSSGRLGAVLSILLLAAEISALPQAPTITVKSAEVRVDVLVSDHGKPVYGLGPKDFEVSDNGVRQEINFASQQHIPFNAVLIFDMSASVAGPKLFNLKDAGLKFLDGLRRDEHVALVTFCQAVHRISNLTTD